MAAINSKEGGGSALPLSASISPESINEPKASIGAYTSPLFVCSASGGKPPYSYSWSIDGDFSLSSTSDNQTRASTGGWSGARFGSLTCTVVDSDSNEVSVSARITVIFDGRLLL